MSRWPATPGLPIKTPGGPPRLSPFPGGGDPETSHFEGAACIQHDLWSQATGGPLARRAFGSWYQPLPNVGRGPCHEQWAVPNFDLSQCESWIHGLSSQRWGGRLPRERQDGEGQEFEKPLAQNHEGPWGGGGELPQALGERMGASGVWQEVRDTGLG